ncbi:MULTISPECIES: filamentous haemagglutinin family protein [unclassified Bradyrhizobium]
MSPTVPTTGAGIATLNPMPEVPPGNVDLIAPLGTIDAGEAGIRVSGNVNLAALQIVNAASIQVQGSATGIPVVQAPPVAALSSAGNATAATQQSAAPTQSNNDRPSVILVEFLGFGGGDGSLTPNPNPEKKRSGDDGRAQNPDSAYQVLGAGEMTMDEAKQLIAQRRRRMQP